MSLLPLPKKIILHTQLPDHYWYGDVVGHTDAAMQAYGQQCRDAALKESAQICDAYHGTALTPSDCANEIRRMTGTSQKTRQQK
jgi:hypothetical protein